MSESTGNTESAVRYERGADGVVLLTFDDPASTANTMNEAYVRGMGEAVDRLEAERESITGVVLTSAKTTFFAGGDVTMMIASRPEQADELTGWLSTVKAQLRRLERLGRPVVAGDGGSALGGGLEIALACHHRIAVDDARGRYGFPEVTLGLLPGAGGVTRTVRMMGITPALTTILLEGKQFRAGQAQQLGLLDELVATPEELLPAARAWIAEHPDAVQPWDVKGHKIPGGTPNTPSLAVNLPAYPANLRKRLKGCADAGAQGDHGGGGREQPGRRGHRLDGRDPVPGRPGRLAGGEEHDEGVLRRHAADQQGCGPAEGPAAVAPAPGRRARRRDDGRRDRLRAGQGRGRRRPQGRLGRGRRRGKAYSERLLAKAVSRGRTTQADADALLARITPTGDVDALAGCDLMVEAVFEDPALKRGVYRRPSRSLDGGALLASNTSTLPIAALAEGVGRPQDFIGLHFFSPVDKMPLVEIVVGEQTGDAALARAFDVVRLIGKTPIVVNDSHGFFTSRVIGWFMDEALDLLAEGVHPASIEQAALQAGYPTGPLALSDEVSLTLAQTIRAGFAAAAQAQGRQFPELASHAVIDRMVGEFGRPGRAGKAGFYDYSEDGTRQGLWPGLVEHWGRAAAADPSSPPVPWPDMQERMLFAEALDAVRCLDEGVLRSVAEGNVGSILGIGFPPWTGGVLQYVEGYPGGVAGFVARARELAARYGERFSPPASLVARAEQAQQAGGAGAA